MALCYDYIVKVNKIFIFHILLILPISILAPEVASFHHTILHQKYYIDISLFYLTLF